MSNDLPKDKPILYIDFDEVIHSYTSKRKRVDNATPDGTVEFLKEATEHFEVRIFFSRSHKRGEILEMIKWLHSCVSVASSDVEWFYKIEWPIQKPFTFSSINNRTMFFTKEFPNPKKLFKFKPWYKKKNNTKDIICPVCGKKIGYISKEKQKVVRIPHLGMRWIKEHFCSLLQKKET